MAVKIFFCYAHEDEPLLKRLKIQLTPLQRQGLIEMWHDRDINAGSEWEQEISERLNTAQIIVLLISPDFMASDYCYGTEMKRALERHKRKEACVIPIILRPVYWQDILGNIQALPKDAIPVMSSSWHSTDDALFNVAEGIRKEVEDIQSEARLNSQARENPTQSTTTSQTKSSVQLAPAPATNLSSAPSRRSSIGEVFSMIGMSIGGIFVLAGCFMAFLSLVSEVLDLFPAGVANLFVGLMIFFIAHIRQSSFALSTTMREAIIALCVGVTALAVGIGAIIITATYPNGIISNRSGGTNAGIITIIAGVILLWTINIRIRKFRRLLNK